ncbi:MAG TPA: type II toxin-antitoxin system VapC family toxin [Stellaceae bacterium]
MTRYLLDTNIVSNATRPVPSPSLEAWITDQLDEDLYVSAFTLAEIWRGILIAPAGRRKDRLLEWFSGPTGPQALFSGRILPFDERAALIWARLMANGSAAGRPRSGIDMIIAAVAEANDCVIVSDNERDFAGLRLFNPMRAAP